MVLPSTRKVVAKPGLYGAGTLRRTLRQKEIKFASPECPQLLPALQLSVFLDRKSRLLQMKLSIEWRSQDPISYRHMDTLEQHDYTNRLRSHAVMVGPYQSRKMEVKLFIILDASNSVYKSSYVWRFACPSKPLTPHIPLS